MRETTYPVQELRTHISRAAEARRIRRKSQRASKLKRKRGGVGGDTNVRVHCCVLTIDQELGLAARQPRHRGSQIHPAPSHSITSSARARRVGGIVRLSALAVCRLMTSSNLVGCSMGSSAGFSPLRMRSA